MWRSPLRINSSILLLIISTTSVWAQTPDSGKVAFENNCGKCHGADGKGGEMGPSIVYRLSARNDGELARLIRSGLPDRGMPPVRIADQEMPALLAHLRAIQRDPSQRPKVHFKAKLLDGTTLDGQVMAEGFDDLQLITDDKRVHLLRRSGDRFREVTSQRDWPGYDGDPGGNRYTTVAQIDKSNVGRLSPKWIFPVPNGGGLQGTPVVAGGIMYVTIANQCWALDAGSGREIWHFFRKTTRGETNATAGPTNRGAAVAGDRVFMDTDEAHIIALNRFTGELLWETVIADWRDNYFTSSAPQVAGDLVLSGIAGGEHGANGFVAAFDQATGKEVWRFLTVPKPGAPGSETWQGQDILHGGAPTWFTGTYDPELDVVYWPTGNPSKEYNGDQRIGDNLYSDCILALDRKTGRLKWYYQFTPHDLWDWDATETSVLVDAEWQGRPRKLMLHADRNGFFYVFDRADGKLLLWKPFVKNLTWASGIDSKGRPIKNPNQEPSKEGTLVCPSQDGATNWYSPSYNPATGLYYVQTFEKCSVYTKREGDAWEAGKSYLGGSQRTAEELKPQRVLKAIDIGTGNIVWELPQNGPAYSWGGTLSTASGLVIVAEESGALLAVDASNGKPLWNFQANVNWHASPMTYVFDGQQYIAIAAGSNIISFAVPEQPAVQPAPQAEIAGSGIRAKIWLPDAANGYYRGTRFDWSGAIQSLEWKGHNYFGKWFDRYDPKLHDAITGPVEEFVQSPGYDEAKVGETFVRIGVGTVRKPEEQGYQRFKTYDIVDAGKWSVAQSKDAIEFTHELTDPAGYSYVYRKQLRLTTDGLVIEHQLKNTGRKMITTSVYQHNFFMLDSQPTGPAMVVRFPFEVRAKADFHGLAEVRGKELRYLHELASGETVFSELEGFGAAVSDYDIRVENRTTGAAVRQTGDRPISKIVFWSIRTTVCPEAYIDLKIEPGQETSWRIKYDFYEVKR